jgi:hypothetical protein
MRIIITVLGLMMSVGLFAQTHQIEKHNGQKLEVNFIKHENNLLHYSSVGSSEQHKISKYAVAYLHHKTTSKSEAISLKVEVNSKNDFKKVAVIDVDHAIGFDTKTNFEVYHGVNKGGTSFFIKEDSIRRIKYKSAQLGYPFVTIVDNSNGKYEAVAYNY